MRLRSLATLLIVIFSANSFATDYFVDTGIATTCSDYSSNTRACGAGTETAYPDLNSGIAALSAGDTLFLRDGTYGQIVVTSSGTAGQPISIRGMSGEIATVTSAGLVALSVTNRTDIVLADLVVVDSEGFGRIENSSRITIDNVDFSNAGASGTTGSLKFVRSSFNQVLNSSFDNGSDLLLLQDDSDQNVLSGNTFGRAAHSLISIRCASKNVIRNNDFNNPQQKIMEMFDCEGISDAPVRLDDASGNLLELNRFSGTAASGAANNFNAIQHGAQDSIVRQNVFSNNLGGAVNYQYYGQESLFVHGNRLYNNTFYNNSCFAIIGQSGSGSQFFDNQGTNNLLFGNTSCSGGSGQTSISNSAQVILSNNTLATSDPGFVNASGGDLTLLESSSEIDSAIFVALTSSSGSGVTLQVDDASWFYDGYGISTEVGDTIQLEGDTQSAQITSIDYASNTITLSSALTWSNAQGVHLAYSGNAPDVGAFEYSGPVIRPNPPENLQVN